MADFPSVSARSIRAVATGLAATCSVEKPQAENPSIGIGDSIIRAETKCRLLGRKCLALLIVRSKLGITVFLQIESAQTPLLAIFVFALPDFALC